MSPSPLIATRERSWIWLLFGEQRVDRQSVTSLLTHWQPRAQVYLAELDDHSQRAQQWTRDPLGQIPSGRLAITPTQSLDAELIRAVNALLSTTPYHCYTREPKRLPLSRGERYAGTLQLCCFRRLCGLSDDALAQAWLDRHTNVALNTQSTEGYRQHWVTSQPTPSFDGIVEEYFPEEAATSVEHFFNAVGDRDRLKQHVAAMTKSTSQFLDLEQSEVVHLTDTRLM